MIILMMQNKFIINNNTGNLKEERGGVKIHNNWKKEFINWIRAVYAFEWYLEDDPLNSSIIVYGLL